MKKMTSLFLVSVLLLSFFLGLNFALADSDDDQDRSKREVRIRDDNGIERRIRIEEKEGEIRAKIGIRIHSEDNDGSDVEVELEDELEIEQEIEDERTKIKIRTKKGELKELRVLPDEALAKFVTELGIEDIDMEIKEQEDEAVYEARVEKESRFLGIFKVKMKITGFINLETGEFNGKKKAWWAFMASGEDDVQTGQITICHYPQGNPENAQTITVGGPAVNTHLSHGDTLGPCAGGNQTTTPPIINNTNVTIPSMNNTNVSTSGNMTPVNVEITIDDQGDKIIFTVTPASEIFVYSLWDSSSETFIPTSGDDIQTNTWALIENRNNIWEYVKKLPSCITPSCGSCDNTIACNAGGPSPSPISQTNSITFEWDKKEFSIESETCSWGQTQCYNNINAEGNFKIKFNYLVGCVQNTETSSQFPYICPDAISLIEEETFTL
ncbi:MAG: hypothetical protein Q8P57_00200 [Candidatus Pacearchaeota archaeon]|nr:hypothetical protein [Candidatus Pacearchaeota archaeon]